MTPIRLGRGDEISRSFKIKSAIMKKKTLGIFLKVGR